MRRLRGPAVSGSSCSAREDDVGALRAQGHHARGRARKKLSERVELATSRFAPSSCRSRRIAAVPVRRHSMRKLLVVLFVALMCAVWFRTLRVESAGPDFVFPLSVSGKAIQTDIFAPPGFKP